MSDESIYDSKRLALPDEAWNFRRGDGLEKALLMADMLHHTDHGKEIIIETGKKVILRYEGRNYTFISRKGFNKLIRIAGDDYSVEERTDQNKRLPENNIRNHLLPCPAVDLFLQCSAKHHQFIPHNRRTEVYIEYLVFDIDLGCPRADCLADGFIP
jgi:hypothetical protein